MTYSTNYLGTNNHGGTEARRLRRTCTLSVRPQLAIREHIVHFVQSTTSSLSSHGGRESDKCLTKEARIAHSLPSGTTLNAQSLLSVPPCLRGLSVPVTFGSRCSTRQSQLLTAARFAGETYIARSLLASGRSFQ
jgi:hypothetical protein